MSAITPALPVATPRWECEEARKAIRALRVNGHCPRAFVARYTQLHRVNPVNARLYALHIRDAVQSGLYFEEAQAQ